MHKSAQRAGAVLEDSARLLLRVAWRFAAITFALVVIGVVYAYLSGPGFNPTAIPAWFLRLSPEQWISLAFGVIVAFIVVGVPCSRIAGVAPGEPRQSVARRVVQNLAILAVVVLYFWGVRLAYHLSLALGHSHDWAIIHSLYSWVYVGVSFVGWAGSHSKQPLGKALHQFRLLLGK